MAYRAEKAGIAAEAQAKVSSSSWRLHSLLIKLKAFIGNWLNLMRFQLGTISSARVFDARCPRGSLPLEYHFQCHLVASWHHPTDTNDTGARLTQSTVLGADAVRV